ncbi:MAG TPA: polysaccharide deacetylase family protein [Ktedonobacteraceae bacterium]
MKREQQLGTESPDKRAEAENQPTQPLPMDALKAIGEESQAFPAHMVEIFTEEKRLWLAKQAEIAHKEISLLPGTPAGKSAGSPTPFLGLPEEQTLRPAALCAEERAEARAVRPLVVLAEEQTPWSLALSDKAKTTAAPVEYLLEIEQTPTTLLPARLWRQRLARQRASLWLACVSGLLVALLLAISVLTLRGRLHTPPTTVPLNSISIGQNPVPTLQAPLPTSSSQPRPIRPLPSTLAAQIATLELHDRFFYNGNLNLPEIALTFDDGPSLAYTPQVLAILKQYHVKATFFDIGRLVQAYPDLVRQELKGGHDVGNHTWTHADLPLLSPKAIKAQIQQTSAAIEKAIGVRPIYMRPPYGDISARVLPVINDFALTTVIWNDEARDWSLPGTSVIVERILNLARNGAIILLHDGGGVRAQTVQALPIIIEDLRARGYTFVTMDELIAHIDKNKHKGITTPTPTPGLPSTPQPESVWSRQGDLAPFSTLDERRKKFFRAYATFSPCQH